MDLAGSITAKVMVLVNAVTDPWLGVGANVVGSKCDLDTLLQINAGSCGDQVVSFLVWCAGLFTAYAMPPLVDFMGGLTMTHIGPVL